VPGILVVGLLVESVVTGVPWRQRVKVVLTRDGTAVPDQRLKLLIASGDPSADSCTPAGLEGSTNAEGRFEGTRWQWSTLIRFCAVEVRYDALCVQGPGGWQPVWQTAYGPAPSVLGLACDLARPPTRYAHPLLHSCEFGERAERQSTSR
jgi:hypothetical protein